MRSAVFRGAIAGLLVFGIWSSGSTAASTVHVNQAGAVGLAVLPQTQSVTVGAIFEWTIQVNAGDQELDAADAYLNFNSNFLKVVDSAGNEASAVTPGETLKVALVNRVDNSLGQIDFVAGRSTGDPAPKGVFVLAAVRFRAVQAGGSALDFSIASPRQTQVTFQGQSVLGPTTGGVASIAAPAPAPSGGGGGGGGGGGSSRTTPTPTPTSQPSPTATPVPVMSPSIRTPLKDGAVQDMDPLLGWTNPPGATQYQVMVVPFNNDGPGINLIIGDAAMVAKAQYQVQPPELGIGNYVMLPGMTYTWQVRTATAGALLKETDDGWGSWATSTFGTGQSLNTVSLVSPAEGAVVDNATPTLQWLDSNPRIFYYEVQVSKDPTFTIDPATASAMVYWELRHGGQTTPLNSYSVPSKFPLERGSAYFWRVRPRVQGDGAPVAWSAASSFNIP